MSHNVAECPTSQNHLLRRFPLVTPSPYHVIVLLSLLLSLPSFASPATQPSGQLLPWLDNLEDAYKEAGRTQKPILVIFSADWCEPCKALHEQIETPAAQKTLASWTRVNLNFDTDEADANLLNATRIPALRILTPAGALIASHDGPMSADTLTAWLTSSAAEATVALGAEFTGAASPDAATLAKLVDALGSSKSLLREA
ncbi:MAG TPA: thioredoxin family protein, partial [Tepidisphaeraceae bacterium]